MKLTIRKILVPVDFSEYSSTVLEIASSIARDNRATLIITHVVEPEATVAAAPYVGVAAENVDDARGRLEQLVPEDPAVPHVHRLQEGPAIAGIADLAEREQVDLIVMATHGRRGLSRVVMGSVAEGVIRRAQCPVLALKQSQLAPEEEPNHGEAGRAQGGQENGPQQTSTQTGGPDKERLQDYLG